MTIHEFLRQLSELAITSQSVDEAEIVNGVARPQSARLLQPERDLKIVQARVLSSDQDNTAAPGDSLLRPKITQNLTRIEAAQTYQEQQQAEETDRQKKTNLYAFRHQPLETLQQVVFEGETDEKNHDTLGEVFFWLRLGDEMRHIFKSFGEWTENGAIKDAQALWNELSQEMKVAVHHKLNPSLPKVKTSQEYAKRTPIDKTLLEIIETQNAWVAPDIPHHLLKNYPVNLAEVTAMLSERGVTLDGKVLESVVVRSLDHTLEKLPTSTWTSFNLTCQQLLDFLSIFAYQHQQLRFNDYTLLSIFIERYQEFAEKNQHLSHGQKVESVRYLWDIVSAFNVKQMSSNQLEFLVRRMEAHTDLDHPLATEILALLPEENSYKQEQLQRVEKLVAGCSGQPTEVLNFLTTVTGRQLRKSIITVLPTGWNAVTLGIELEHRPDVVGVTLPAGFFEGSDDDVSMPELRRGRHAIPYNPAWQAEWAELRQTHRFQQGGYYSLHLHTLAESQELAKQFFFLNMLFDHGQKRFDAIMILANNQDLLHNSTWNTVELRLPLKNYPGGHRHHHLTYDTRFFDFFLLAAHLGYQDLRMPTAKTKRPKRLEFVIEVCSDPLTRAAAAVLFAGASTDKDPQALANTVIPRNLSQIEDVTKWQLEHLPELEAQSYAQRSIQSFWRIFRNKTEQKTAQDSVLSFAEFSNLWQNYEACLPFLPITEQRALLNLAYENSQNETDEPIAAIFKLQALLDCLERADIYSPDELKSLLKQVELEVEKAPSLIVNFRYFLYCNMGFLIRSGAFSNQTALNQYIQILQARASADKNEDLLRQPQTFLLVCVNNLDFLFGDMNDGHYQLFFQSFDIDLETCPKLFLFDLLTTLVRKNKSTTQPSPGGKNLLRLLVNIPEFDVVCAATILPIANWLLPDQRQKVLRLLLDEAMPIKQLDKLDRFFDQHHTALDLAFGLDLLPFLQKILDKIKGMDELTLTIIFYWLPKLMADQEWLRSFKDYFFSSACPKRISNHYLKCLHNLYQEYQSGAEVYSGITFQDIADLWVESKDLPGYPLFIQGKVSQNGWLLANRRKMSPRSYSS